MLSRLTRYEILGALASGGMADVWLARVSGPHGFDKLVVVKTIRPNLAVEPSFVEMFFNEARVAALLNHPNCVQIHDVGAENGISYIAMEFIDGFSLGRVLKRAETRRITVPPEILARIFMDASAGLEHAHTLVDRKGAPLGLVHRDVSPDNVLVGFNGQTKLVDFGIAKAAGPKAPGESTRTGTLKGKFGYMAPEYLMGEPIDGRADQFALGVVMYRAFTGSKPFNGATEALVCNAVLNLQPQAPSALNPQVPPALEEVVMRALSKQPGQRYESAKALRKAIEKAAAPADTDDVAAFMEQLWAADDDERGRVRALASGQAAGDQPALEQVGSASIEVNVTLHTATSQVATPAPPLPPREKKRSLAPLLVLAGVVVVAAGAVTGWMMKRGDVAVVVDASPPKPLPAPVPEPAPRPPDPTPPATDAPPVQEGPGKVELTSLVPMEISFDGKPMGKTPATLELPAGVQTLKLTNRELGTRTMQVTVAAGQVVKARTPVGRGSVEVRVSPWASVKIDGRAIGDTPLPPQDLVEGRHVIELSNAKLGKSKRVTVNVAPGDKKLVRETFE